MKRRRDEEIGASSFGLGKLQPGALLARNKHQKQYITCTSASACLPHCIKRSFSIPFKFVHCITRVICCPQRIPLVLTGDFMSGTNTVQHLCCTPSALLWSNISQQAWSIVLYHAVLSSFRGGSAH